MKIYEKVFFGVPYEYTEKVFNPFERLNWNIPNKYSENWGFGLGLFAVRKMIEKMNGIEFGRNLRMIEAFKTTPIIFVTTEISDLFQKEIEKIGVAKWLNKPFDSNELLTCLK